MRRLSAGQGFGVLIFWTASSSGENRNEESETGIWTEWKEPREENGKRGRHQGHKQARNEQWPGSHVKKRISIACLAMAGQTPWEVLHTQSPVWCSQWSLKMALENPHIRIPRGLYGVTYPSSHGLRVVDGIRFKVGSHYDSCFLFPKDWDRSLTFGN